MGGKRGGESVGMEGGRESWWNMNKRTTGRQGESVGGFKGGAQEDAFWRNANNL